MGETWAACDCCDGDCPEHALLTVRDGIRGEPVRLRVPWAARQDPVGWGPGRRITWRDPVLGERMGLLHAEGERGVIGRDPHTEELFSLPHGTYQAHQERQRFTTAQLALLRRPAPLRKAESEESPSEATASTKRPALKAGERWITVHPNGDDEKGVPILIRDEGDGVARVIGGAGGKMNHLKLHHVVTGDQAEATWKERAKKRAAAEKERKAALPPEARAAERKQKQDLDIQRRMAEDRLISTVREKVGGVSPDLEPAVVAGLSEKTKNMVLAQHRRRQLGEAQRQAAVARDKLLDAAAKDHAETTKLRAEIEAEPALGREALEIADLQARADEETARARREQRNVARTMRITQDDRSTLGREAVEAHQETLKAATEQLAGGDVDKALEALPQLPDEQPAPAEGVAVRPEVKTAPPSLQEKRKALEALREAQVLTEAATTEGANLEAPVVQLALDRAGVPADATETEKRAALLNEAGAKVRAAEVGKIKADRYSKIEGDPKLGGVDAAVRAHTFAARSRGLIKNLDEQQRAGLHPDAAAPVQDVELAALAEVLRSEKTLREARAGWKSVQRAVERKNPEMSRRSWGFSWAPLGEDLVQEMEDKLRTQSARGLAGLAAKGHGSYVDALSAGHFDVLADTALGVTRQRYMDRVTMEAVGLRNASLLLRHAMEQAGVDTDALLAAVEGVHVENQITLAQRAMERVQELVPDLDLRLEKSGDLEHVLAQLDLSEVEVDAALQTVGASLGRLEGQAALAQAFRAKVPENMVIEGDAASLPRQLHFLQAAGLRPGDYKVDVEAGRIEVPKSAWNRMIRTDPPEVVQAAREAVAIRNGAQDEQGWLPAGFSRRPPGRAEKKGRVQFYEDLAWKNPDRREATESYIAGRLLDGENPAEIYSDLLSPTFAASAPSDQAAEAIRRHVLDIFPLKDADGKPRSLGQMTPELESMVARHMERRGVAPSSVPRFGGLDTEDAQVREAVYGVLAERPEYMAALKAPGELSRTDRKVLREHFYTASGMGKDKLTAEQVWADELAELGPEPERYKKSGQRSMLALMGGGGGGGDREESEEWRQWKADYDRAALAHPWADREAAERALGPRPPDDNPLGQQVWDDKRDRVQRAQFNAETPWGRYVAQFSGSEDLALATIQEHMRGGFWKSYQDRYEGVSGSKVPLGVSELTNSDAHRKGFLRGAERQALTKELQQENARAQGGVGVESGGKGSVLSKRLTMREQEAARGQQQMGMGFGGRAAAVAKAPEAAMDFEAEPKAHQRYTLGERAEGQVRQIALQVSGNLEYGKPIELAGGISMDGPRIVQQRAIKQVVASRRSLGALGAGSGKTPIMIGSLTEAMSRGEAFHGLFTTPAKVEDQFRGEVARFTEPGKFQSATGTGSSYEQRLAQLKDHEGTHVKVWTHEAFRDTLLRMIADHEGKDPATVLREMRKAPVEANAKRMAAAREAHGIKPWFLAVDEAHRFTSRDATGHGFNVIGMAAAHGANSTHRMMASGTPHKNEAAEIASMAGLVYPERYGDRSRFLANYGDAVTDVPDAVRRELEPYSISAAVRPEGVERRAVNNPMIDADGVKRGRDFVPLHPEHKALMDRVETTLQRATAARAAGGVDVEAMRELAPGAFEGKPEADHEAIAKKMQPYLLSSVAKEARRRAALQAPAAINSKLQAMMDVVEHDHRKSTWTDRKGVQHVGKPSIVFSSRIAEVKLVKEEAERRGLRVGTITGPEGTQAAEAARRAYQKGDLDLLVCSNAAEAGLNVQRAKVVHHFDLPDTDKTHDQRGARAYRIGQQGDVDIHNWVADNDQDRRATQRLARKHALGQVFQSALFDLDEKGVAGAFREQIAHKYAVTT